MMPLIKRYNCTHSQLVTYICKTYGIGVAPDQQFMHPHRMRRETIARRLRLYRDQAAYDVRAVIDQVYETQAYKETLYRYVPYALEQNVTRRIVDEIASLYDRPVLRTIKDPARNERLRAEEKRLHLHELAQEGHRLLTLCNEVLQWQYKTSDGKTKIRLVTPDAFDAVPCPQDSLEMAGLLLDMSPTTHLVGDSKTQLPHFELWDDTYRYLINGHGFMVDPSGALTYVPQAHGLGRIPGVLLHRREPTTTLLDASHGADIESCHLGVALLNVMILRISKSQGENQPVLQGNLAAVASGQSANGERPLLLPPEVVASVLNTKTDASHYIAVKRDKITSVAQTYGMSYEQFSNTETADSGKLYELRREKLKEIRNESRRRAVMHEAQTLDLIGIGADGLRLDYQEQSLPQDASEKLSLLKENMRLGLDSPIRYMQREDPDLEREEAISRMRENLVDYGDLIGWQRALNAPADADASNPGRTPQENGADNAKKDTDDEGDDKTPPQFKKPAA